MQRGAYLLLPAEARLYLSYFAGLFSNNLSAETLSPARCQGLPAYPRESSIPRLLHVDALHEGFRVPGAFDLDGRDDFTNRFVFLGSHLDVARLEVLLQVSGW